MSQRFIEKIMYASRWVMAPVYLGMGLVLGALAIKFFQELYGLLPHLFMMSENEVILKLLNLIDLTLVGSLTVIVMFSGYDNFVAQLDIDDNNKKLEWLGTHDYASLKMKVASSIVAISSIHLLKIFMAIPSTPDNKLMWYVIVHLALVVSALFMGFLDKLTKHT